MEILRCENVRKVYGSGNNQVVALNHIDLSVQKGEFVAIVGASGAERSIPMTAEKQAAVAAEERRAEEQQRADSLARTVLEEASAEPAEERPANNNEGFFD